MDVVDFSKYVYKLLKEREEDIARSLANGSAKDWGDLQNDGGRDTGTLFCQRRNQVPAGEKR